MSRVTGRYRRGKPAAQNSQRAGASFHSNVHWAELVEGNFLNKYTMVCWLALTQIVASCAAEPLKEYPNSWSPIAPTSNCEVLSGNYLNKALQTTYWKSPYSSKPSDAYLSSLLTNGGPGSYSEGEPRLKVLELDAGKKQFSGSMDSGETAALGPSQDAWHCTSDGHLQIDVVSHVTSEDSEGSATIALVLFKTADNSLVVRREITIRRISFGVVPNGATEIEWMLFRAL